MPTVDSVQSGAETITSGDGTSHTVTITSVDTSRSVVLFTSRNASGDARMLRHLFKAELTNGTTITFTRNNSSFAANVDVEWTVIEFASGELQSLQSGTYDATADPTDITLGTTLSDAGQAVPIIYFATNDDFIDGSNLSRATFPNTSTLRSDFDSAPSTGNQEAAYQVIEFKSADASIQSGTISLTSAEVSDTATITSVDTGLSFIAHGGLFASGGSSPSERLRATMQLTNATTVEMKRGDVGSTEAQDGSFYVVELPSGGAVETGEVSIPDGNTAPVTQPSFTALTDGKSVVWDSWTGENWRGPASGETSTGNDDGDVLVSAKLDADEAGVTISRGRSVGDVHYAWHAVDFSAGGGGTAFTQSVSGSVTPAGALTRKTMASFAGSITPIGRVFKKSFLDLAGSITATGALATRVVIQHAISGSITPAGALAKKTMKSLGGSITATGALARKTKKALSGSITAAGALVKKTAKSFAGSITATGALASGFKSFQAISGSITAAGSVAGSLIVGVASQANKFVGFIKNVGRGMMR